MKAVRINDLKYGIKSASNWLIAEQAPLTASGYHEVVATFATKAAAERWARSELFGRRHTTFLIDNRRI